MTSNSNSLSHASPTSPIPNWKRNFKQWAFARLEKNGKRMSRDPRYQKLLNSPRWAEVKRIVWQRAGGQCERCKREGYVTAGVDCHHIKPVEGAKTVDGPDGMRERAYNPDNIELLCVACHIKTHKEMRSHTKDKVMENKALGAERRASWLDPNYEANKVDDADLTKP